MGISVSVPPGTGWGFGLLIAGTALLRVLPPQPPSKLPTASPLMAWITVRRAMVRIDFPLSEIDEITSGAVKFLFAAAARRYDGQLG
jgi:hypothetical protein